MFMFGILSRRTDTGGVLFVSRWNSSIFVKLLLPPLCCLFTFVVPTFLCLVVRSPLILICVHPSFIAVVASTWNLWKFVFNGTSVASVHCARNFVIALDKVKLEHCHTQRFLSFFALLCSLCMVLLRLLLSLFSFFSSLLGLLVVFGRLKQGVSKILIMHRVATFQALDASREWSEA